MVDLRVLLIDDDETTNFLHRRVIAKTGISADIEVAVDGRAGLAVLQRLIDAGEPLPDLILLDLNMPRMNGFEFLDSFVSLPDDARSCMQIFMVTSSVLSADQTRALEHPAVQGLRSKPLSVPVAREVLEGVVASLPPGGEPASVASRPRDPIATVDELVGDDGRIPLAALDALDTAAWVCVVDDSRVVWANRRGLELWGAASLAALGERDWDNNTPAARAGVRHMWEVARREGRCPSRWTLHPNGDPVTVDQVATAWTLPDGRDALLVEAREVTQQNPDASTRRRAEVLRYAPTPIAMVDDRGAVASWNPAFLEEFAPDGNARVPLDAEGAQRLLSATSENRRIEFEQDIDRNGRARSYLIRSDPAVDPVTSRRAAVVSFTDLTDIAGRKRALARALEDARRVQASLDERRQEVERSNRDLESFAHVASHDLKAPVRRIAGFADLLREESGDVLGERGYEYLERIVRGCNQMGTLLSDLLAFSSVDRDITRHRVPLDEALAEALSMLDLDDAEVTSSPLPIVSGDRSALARVFSNLIGNALKFRSEAAPRVEIGVHESAGTWEISVRDNGIGFAPELAASIFAPFRRLHREARYEGSGLGLSIVRRIVEAHDGRIEARGEEGAGATFVVTLPKV